MRVHSRHDLVVEVLDFRSLTCSSENQSQHIVCNDKLVRFLPGKANHQDQQKQ